MNFEGVKAITIPEGVVKKIMRGSDVLWQASSIVRGDLVYNLEIATSLSGDAVHVKYSTECLNSDGTAVLGETKIVMIESVDDCDVLRGHYAEVEINLRDYVYYIPQEATFTTKGSLLFTDYVASIAYPMVIV